MAFTTDYTTAIGQVRTLICDLDPTKPIFPDDNQINVFLTLEDQAPRLAAALALETIAGNRALTLQVMKVLDLQTDGSKTATALLATAKQFREFAQDDWAGFTVAQVTDDSIFSFREYITKLIVAQEGGY